MGADVENTNQVSAAERDPLGKLGWLMRRKKYKPTAQEAEVIKKCSDDSKWYILNGTLLSGTVVWNLTGTGRKMKLFPRLFMTATGALFGRFVGLQIAINSCTKKLMALEGSPLQDALIAIMQEDFPNHPLLRKTLKQREASLSVHAPEPIDYSHEDRVDTSPEDVPLVSDESIPRSRQWTKLLGNDAGDGEGKIRTIPTRIWEVSERNENARQEFNGADILADPFDLVMLTGVVGDTNDVGGEKKNHVEHRRSRMSAKERRDHDRMQFEQRQLNQMELQQRQEEINF